MVRTRRRLNQSVILVTLVIVAIVMLFPFAYMTLVANQSFDQYLAGGGFSLESWGKLFDAVPVVQELLNSSIVTAGALVIILFVSTLGGFAFAKLGFPGGSVIFLLILAGMMVPVQTIVIPEFVNISQVGLINAYPGAILVYAALGAPFATYLMTTYFHGVPTELMEASLMDGASYLQVFLRVMLPLAVPAIVTVTVLQFIQIWDDLLIGLLFLQTPETRTITVGLATLQNGRMVDVPVLMAGSLASALPAIIVFLVFQRYLVRGLTLGIGK